MSRTDAINAYIEKEIDILNHMDRAAINTAAEWILKAKEEGKTIYTCGNGGSAATASHFVCDFAKGAWEKLGGKPIRMICLNDCMPLVSAIANDISYEEVFSFQLKERDLKGDLLIAISGSGNSPDVLRAVETAHMQGAAVIALTGFDGGKLYQMADLNLHVPVNDMQIAEDIHMILDHMLLKVI